MIWTKAYLINLDSRTDRLEHSDNQLKMNGINYERVSANESSAGFVGCSTSHFNVMMKAYTHGEQPLIIEDDIVIHQPKFSLRIEQIMHLLKNVDWDVFYFYNDGILSNLYYHDGILLNPYVPQYPIVRSGPSACCHFYVINKFSVEKIIKLLMKIQNTTIDLQLILLSKQGIINSFCSSDVLVSQTRSLGSDIKHKKPKEDLNGIFIK
jgi:hypothetical protein